MTRPEREVGLDWLDLLLILVFLLGIYTGYSIQLGAKMPFPSAPSGIAGVALLWRRRDRIEPQHLMVFFGVLIVYIASVLAAFDWHYLPKRFTGLVQLVYSLVISYALFLTLLKARRDQIAKLFLIFCICIVIGCLLEDYGGLRPISDAVRAKLYTRGIYDADLRDELLYGKVRPKLFTSEPSAVTFAFTLFSFCWLLVSRWRWKLLGYVAMMAGGMFAMPGPTLLLMLLLLIPYQLLAARNWQPAALRYTILLAMAGATLGGFIIIGHSVYSTRLHEATHGSDPSTFYRVMGPALVAKAMAALHPIAGSGLTGEPAIAEEVAKVYVASPDYSAAWDISNPADVLTNYFWLHWIYLGIVFGILTLGALTYFLKVLGTPSVVFCWVVWTILGQASGAYVGPKTWAVLFLAAGCSILSERTVLSESATRAVRRYFPVATPMVQWRRPVRL